MKIGILTFHWGTNYGGVLQAYALQQVIKELGFEVSIINYAPITHRDSIINCIIKCIRSKSPRNSGMLLLEYMKEKKFVLFRKHNLALTRRYYSLSELVDDPPAMDVYICGSDQIWHPALAKSIGKPYYLSFGNENVTRIAYAASLGTNIYPKEIFESVQSFLKSFRAISVRETSSIEILNDFGFNEVNLMPDPALLFNKDDLKRLLLKAKKKIRREFCFFYILQENQILIKNIYSYLKKANTLKIISTKKIKSATMGIEDWLQCINDANYVVTNSYHGIIFSILLEKQFITIPLEGKWSPSNDRIFTLLKYFNLEDRLINTYNTTILQKVINTPINWAYVNGKLEIQKKQAQRFLEININSK